MAANNVLHSFASAVAVAAVLCSGCASTKVTAFRDPEFAARQYAHLAVFVRGTSLPVANEMEQRICTTLAPAPCSRGLELLPPTRDYTASDVTEIIGRSGADGVLILKFGNDRSDSGVLGYQTFATAQATGTANTTGTFTSSGGGGTYSGSTYGSAQATGHSTTIPIMYFSRAADGGVTLLDAATGKKAWTGEMQTSGRGLLNTTNDAFESSQCREIVSQLKAAGLVAK